MWIVVTPYGQWVSQLLIRNLGVRAFKYYRELHSGGCTRAAEFLVTVVVSTVEW